MPGTGHYPVKHLNLSLIKFSQKHYCFCFLDEYKLHLREVNSSWDTQLINRRAGAHQKTPEDHTLNLCTALARAATLCLAHGQYLMNRNSIRVPGDEGPTKATLPCPHPKSFLKPKFKPPPSSHAHPLVFLAALCETSQCRKQNRTAGPGRRVPKMMQS